MFRSWAPMHMAAPSCRSIIVVVLACAQAGRQAGRQAVEDGHEDSPTGAGIRPIQERSVSVRRLRRPPRELRALQRIFERADDIPGSDRVALIAQSLRASIRGRADRSTQIDVEHFDDNIDL